MRSTQCQSWGKVELDILFLALDEMEKNLKTEVLCVYMLVVAVLFLENEDKNKGSNWTSCVMFV